jgi:hypothetical protein
MNFQRICDLVTSQIKEYSTMKYLNPGTDYFTVLGIKDGKIVEFGEIAHPIIREKLFSGEDLIRFGRECEDFRLGFRTTMPSFCYQYQKEDNEWKLGIW